MHIFLAFFGFRQIALLLPSRFSSRTPRRRTIKEERTRKLATAAISEVTPRIFFYAKTANRRIEDGMNALGSGSTMESMEESSLLRRSAGNSSLFVELMEIEPTNEQVEVSSLSLAESMQKSGTLRWCIGTIG